MLFHDDVDFLYSDVLAKFGEGLNELFFINVTIVVKIELIEETLKNILFLENFWVDCCSQEFSVTDCFVMIRVHFVKYFLDRYLFILLT